MDDAKPLTESGSKPEKVRRVGVPPALKLSEAVILAQKVNERAAGSASYDTFSQITGNTKTSSTFSRKVSAMRQYGLIEDRDNFVTLSDLGNRVVTPRDENDDALAIKEALLKIDLLNRIYERHRGRILPEDHFLNNVLLQEFKIPRDFSAVWVEHFKDAATAAKLLFSRGDGKVQVTEGPASGGALTSAVSLGTPAAPQPPADPQKVIFDGALPVPLGPGKLAFLKLPETWDSSKDLKRLLKMLELSLSEDVDPEVSS